MNPAPDALGLAVAAISYITCASLRIELELGDVALGAAFAPTLVLLSAAYPRVEAVALVLVAISAALVATVQRRGHAVAVRDLVALCSCAATTHLARAVLLTRTVQAPRALLVLVAGAAGVLAYSLASSGLAYLKAVNRPQDRHVWLWLEAVLVSGYGLMILAYGQVGWPALAAMLVVLGLTKREFDRYAIARRLLRQTTDALDELRRLSLL